MSKLTEVKESFPIEDNHGNSISVAKDKFILELASGSSRTIGLLQTNSKEQLFYCKNLNRREHVMRINDSIGFNVGLIENLPQDTICHVLLDNTTKYLARVSHVRQCGSYLHFKNQGFEKQIFLPRNMFQKVIEV